MYKLVTLMYEYLGSRFYILVPV